ncbi:unnamed protein product [Sympodiomycopsis kandeliae]
MAPVTTLALGATRSRSPPINDENARSTPASGRSSRNSHRSSLHGNKEPGHSKSLTVGQSSLFGRRSISDAAIRKRVPLSNTTNTMNNNRASGHMLKNELAEKLILDSKNSPSLEAVSAHSLDFSADSPRGHAAPSRSPRVESVSEHEMSAFRSQDSTRAPFASPRTVPRAQTESPPRSNGLTIDVKAANALLPRSMDSATGVHRANSAALSSATVVADQYANRQQQQQYQSPDVSIDGPVATPDQSRGPRPEEDQQLSSDTIAQAISNVLQEHFGVRDIQDLPQEQANALKNGQLATLVAKYIRDREQRDGALLAAPSPLQDLDYARSPSPPVILSPPPFPADALPSEIQLEQNTNLYLSGLAETMTDDQLLRLGTLYGDVISHKAIINSETGLCKGYGFVMYAKAKEAAVAMVELQRQGFLTSFARHESFSAKLRSMADEKSTNVYVSNLPLTLDDESLAELVRPHSIVSRRILVKPDGTSRGVGFIRFQNRDIAQDCIDRLHGKRLPNHPHPLQARFADSETQKRLKQDTTLRKVYADLDMGRLHTPNRSSASNVPVGLPATNLPHHHHQGGNAEGSPLVPGMVEPQPLLDFGARAASDGIWAVPGNFGASPHHGLTRSPVWNPPGGSAFPMWPNNGLSFVDGANNGGSMVRSASQRWSSVGPSSTSTRSSPQFDSPSWSLQSGMSPATSSNSLASIASSLPKSHSNSSLHAAGPPQRLQSKGHLEQGRGMPELPVHHALNFHGLGIGSVEERGHGISGNHIEVHPRDLHGTQGDASSLASLRASRSLRDQVEGALRQGQGLSSASMPGNRQQGMYGTGNVESLSGREALRAAGFVRASEQKSVIPIIDPVTRQALYDHELRRGQEHHGNRKVLGFEGGNVNSFMGYRAVNDGREYERRSSREGSPSVAGPSQGQGGYDHGGLLRHSRDL